MPGERGSQSIEFALVLPLVGMLAMLLVHSALLGGDLVAAQGAARAAARTAAVEDDSAALEAARAAAGARDIDLVIDPSQAARRHGQLVVVRVRMRSSAFGGRVIVPARAAIPAEGP